MLGRRIPVLTNKNKTAFITIFVIILVTLFLQKKNVPFSGYHFSSNFINRLCGPPHHLSPKFAKFIKENTTCSQFYFFERHLIGPSSSPYNLSNQDYYVITLPSWVTLGKFSHFFFKDQSPGFYVEAGALDGVRESNSLYLEKEKKWSGLLVEPNKANFRRLQSKNRKAWISNTCLSKNAHSYKSALHSQHIATGNERSDIIQNYLLSSTATLKESPDLNVYDFAFHSYQEVQCIPVQTLLIALNITRVHLFSLDIEGLEPFILDNFPFNQIFVDILYVEHRFRNASNLDDLEVTQKPDLNFVQRQLDRGLIPYSAFTPHVDYVFVNKYSPFHKKYKDKWPQEWKYQLTEFEDKLKF